MENGAWQLCKFSISYNPFEFMIKMCSQAAFRYKGAYERQLKPQFCLQEDGFSETADLDTDRANLAKAKAQVDHLRARLEEERKVVEEQRTALKPSANDSGASAQGKMEDSGIFPFE